MAHHYDEGPDWDREDKTEKWQKAGFKACAGVLLECTKCSSMVSAESWRKHVKWHEALTQTARKAENASFYSMRIG